MVNLNRIPTYNQSADEDLFAERPAVSNTPTDAELLAALQRGIENGDYIEITDEWLAEQTAALAEEG